MCTGHALPGTPRIIVSSSLCIQVSGGRLSCIYTPMLHTSYEVSPCCMTASCSLTCAADPVVGLLGEAAVDTQGPPPAAAVAAGAASGLGPTARGGEGTGRAMMGSGLMVVSPQLLPDSHLTHSSAGSGEGGGILLVPCHTLHPVSAWFIHGCVFSLLSTGEEAVLRAAKTAVFDRHSLLQALHQQSCHGMW